MKSVVVILTLIGVLSCVSAQNAVKVQEASLLRRSNTNIIVTFNEAMDSVYRTMSNRRFPNRGSKIQALRRGLQSVSRRSQRTALRGLEAFGVETRSFWISNQMVVRGATPRVVAYLSGLPEVQTIEEDVPFILDNPLSQIRQQRPPNGTNEWGVERVGAPEIWDDGQRGKGVRVAVLDSGANEQHEALKDTWAGPETGWHDPTPANSSTPTDSGGHGTHCIGIAVGRMGIGIAPDATWMACKVCTFNDQGRDACHSSYALECAEWILCPGVNSNCSGAAHVVSNSWGGGQGRDTFGRALRAWEEANIFHTFLIGNNGRAGCGSAQSFGDHPAAFSVGSTDEDDVISRFSGRGPSVYGNIVPHISAPGEVINSASHEQNDGYVQKEGTSMATPCVAGAAALMRGANMELTNQEIRDYFMDNAVTGLEQTELCGDDEEGVFPNNLYGAGRLDAAAAYKDMVENSQR